MALLQCRCSTRTIVLAGHVCSAVARHTSSGEWRPSQAPSAGPPLTAVCHSSEDGADLAQDHLHVLASLGQARPKAPHRTSNRCPIAVLSRCSTFSRPAVATRTCIGHVKSLLQEVPHAWRKGQGWGAVGQHAGRGLMRVLALHMELTLRAHVPVRMVLMRALHVGVWRPMLWLHRGLLPANWLPRPLIMHGRQLRLLSSLHALQRPCVSALHVLSCCG